MGDSTYVPCPNCSSVILTEEYLDRFGQCKSCYDEEHVPLDARISHALR